MSDRILCHYCRPPPSSSASRAPPGTPQLPQSCDAATALHIITCYAYIIAHQPSPDETYVPSSALKEQTARSEHLKSFSRHCLYDSTQTSAITFAAPRAGDVPATTQRVIDSDASWATPHPHRAREHRAYIVFNRRANRLFTRSTAITQRRVNNRQLQSVQGEIIF
jgi:hypothetical protein